MRCRIYSLNANKQTRARSSSREENRSQIELGDLNRNSSLVSHPHRSHQLSVGRSSEQSRISSVFRTRPRRAARSVIRPESRLRSLSLTRFNNERGCRRSTLREGQGSGVGGFNPPSASTPFSGLDVVGRTREWPFSFSVQRREDDWEDRDNDDDADDDDEGEG